jgi:hypothetical protein
MPFFVYCFKSSPSPNTRSSLRNASNSLFTAFPSSLPNIRIPTRSPSHHSARQPIPSHLQSQSPSHSLTRTLRSYVPSSINIPIPPAAPSLHLFHVLPVLADLQMVHTKDDYGGECESSFVLYSLRNHHLVKRLPLSGPPSTFTANGQFTAIVSHPTIRFATNLLRRIRRAWAHHLLYSFFPLQDSRLCILYHHCHLSRSRLYFIIFHPLLPLLLLPQVKFSSDT